MLENLNTLRYYDLPFHNTEAGHSVLSAHSIQVAIQHTHAHTGARASGGDHRRPLVGLWVVPLHAVQVAAPIMATWEENRSVQSVLEQTERNKAAHCATWRKAQFLLLFRYTNYCIYTFL